MHIEVCAKYLGHSLESNYLSEILLQFDELIPKM